MVRYILGFWFARPGRLIFFIVVRILCTGIDVAVPVATGSLLDAITADQARSSQSLVWSRLAIYIGLGLSFIVLRGLLSLNVNYITSSNVLSAGSAVFSKVQQFRFSWHQSSHSGGTVRTVNRGMQAFSVLNESLAFGIVPGVLMAIGIIVVYSSRWRLVGLCLAIYIIVFSYISILLALRYVKPANDAAQILDAEVSGRMTDVLTTSSVVKTFAAERREDEELFGVLSRYQRGALHAWNRNVGTAFIQGGLIMVLQCTLLAIGIWLWSLGRATVGDVVMIVVTQTLFIGYLRDIGIHVRNLLKGLGELHDIYILDRRSGHLIEDPRGDELRVSGGHIEFREVVFRYSDQDQRIYENLSCSILPGTKTALVGMSGAGKSTFIKLLQRMYEVESGSIFIDGQDISKVSLDSLRRAVAHVPQDPSLFHRTLHENIVYGKPSATLNEVVDVAKRVNAHAFISAFKNGYSGVVGERGMRLSGGERQRVAIARAIITGSPILVLDEATSSLDVLSEQEIQSTIESVARNKTTIIIAHRLATVKYADQVLVFDAGKIVQAGTHTDLMRDPDGIYRRLVQAQLEGAMH